MEFATIEVERANGIAEIILNRPDKRNALTYEMIDELCAALKEIAALEDAVLILRANGSSFCAGHDYEDMTVAFW